MNLWHFISSGIIQCQCQNHKQLFINILGEKLPVNNSENCTQTDGYCSKTAKSFLPFFLKIIFNSFCFCQFPDTKFQYHSILLTLSQLPKNDYF